MTARSGFSVDASLKKALDSEYGKENYRRDQLRGTSKVKVTQKMANLVAQAAIKPGKFKNLKYVWKA